MQINDICEKQRSDKPENVTLPECPQIGHQITTQQGGEEVGWCDSWGRQREKKKKEHNIWDRLTANSEPSNGYEEIITH